VLRETIKGLAVSAKPFVFESNVAHDIKNRARLGLFRYSGRDTVIVKPKGFVLSVDVAV